jgi:hypothetical protein
MNERIRQLAEQCESFGSWDNKTYSFDKEMFAKLIVQECIDIVDKYGESLELLHIRAHIKDHFGVEE